MRERLEKRLTDLKADFEKGQQQLEGLEQQAHTLRSTLLRISGAIQVLEEELGQVDSSLHNGTSPQAEVTIDH